MAQVNRSALVLHTADEMFELVNDVRRYPEFLPWCSSTEVVHESEDTLEATLYLAKGGLKYSFTTRNSLQRPERMEIKLVEGPFKSLTGIWTFTPLSDEASKVELNMHFEFSGKLTGIAMGKVFNSVATTLVDAFVTRADQVYG
ncbi:type II toxin-antitoxin system RatA family toxin [Marinobacterium lutimaris]|uniref:Ribosome association toxin PasT (RatA) of the RatAB toxin-antitoxin module n=1 Tax=Marinobacterium lutimaris TaxID=568106 RepID=A0A1H6D6P2_9GAMM|nr:type II toxin-antitoxin system RatA family toxin [Marinobacterium lutimaris]SEG81030.1 Ribosome association toxin PasT (RatA) of the RatAB toxin-antitoxin module [Marinobacterium lutimaris]